MSGTLVNGDSYATAVTGTPVYSSTDTATSPAGSTFPVSVSGLDERELRDRGGERDIDDRLGTHYDHANREHCVCRSMATR